MILKRVNHPSLILIGDYQFADKVKEQVLYWLKFSDPISQEYSNVKASFHTIWDWEPQNITFKNLKEFVREEIETHYRPGATSDGSRQRIYCKAFWANVYEKGDYAKSHCHKPSDLSFAYFVKSKWYYPPLIFTDSGTRIRPKEGRYVIFPTYLRHEVPKHKFEETRMTLSGNISMKMLKI